MFPIASQFFTSPLTLLVNIFRDDDCAELFALWGVILGFSFFDNLSQFLMVGILLSCLLRFHNTIIIIS
jgi:hypothetical protein